MGSFGWRGTVLVGATALLSLVAVGCGDDDEGDTSSAAAEATSAAAEASSAVEEATSAAESVASEAESAASSAVEEATSAAEEASSAESGAAPTGKIGVILPDTKSSIRWESFDRPLLGEAFEAAGVEYEIQNAEGDKNRMATIADQMITSGATVLMITNLDSESGAAIEQKAADAGVKTIDYDRLTLNGLADVYVSFDSVKVGEAQGDGLIKCIDRQGRREPGDRRAQRLADGQQRDPVQAGVRLEDQPEVRRG